MRSTEPRMYQAVFSQIKTARTTSPRDTKERELSARYSRAYNKRMLSRDTVQMALTNHIKAEFTGPDRLSIIPPQATQAPRLRNPPYK